MAAAGALQIELQRRGFAHRRAHRVHRGLGHRRAAQIGVQHGAGQIEHRPHRHALALRHPVADGGGQAVVAVGPGRQGVLFADVLARLLQRLAHRLGQGGVAVAAQQARQAVMAQQAVYRGQAGV